MDISNTYWHRTAQCYANLYTSAADRTKWAIITWNTRYDTATITFVLADEVSSVLSAHFGGWLPSGTVASETQPFAFNTTSEITAQFATLYDGFEPLIDLFAPEVAP